MRLPAAASVALVALVALVAFGLTGCTSTLGYAAVVNGAVISQSTLNHQLADLAANKAAVTAIDQGPPGPLAGTSGTGSYNKAFVATQLNQDIQFAVIHQTLVALKALPSAADLAKAKSETPNTYATGIFAAFRPDYQNLLISQDAESNAFIKAETARTAPSAVSAYYQAHLDSYTAEWCTELIVINDAGTGGQIDQNASLADAQKVRGLLQAGGDFATLAMQYSKDSTATKGGVVAGSGPNGCLTLQDLNSLAQNDSQLAQTIFALPVNQVSDAVLTSEGYALVELTKRIPQTLTVASPDIDTHLAGQRLNNLIAHTHIKVNPEFGSFSTVVSTSGNVIGVTPPAVPALGAPTTVTPSGA